MDSMKKPVRVLISACLLGEKVRYDGGHKRDPFLIGTLGPFVEWVRVCPEVDCGLPVPREAMRLAGEPKHPLLVAVGTGIDHTERMERWAIARLEELSGLDLRGYICKKDSPSCGMDPAGVFTRMFIERFPHLPAEEEVRLADPARCGRFLRRVKA
jgi:uncharacterized protein YbbK (DUF523 family)